MSQYTVSFRSGLGLRERVVVVMDSFCRIAAKQGRLTKGNILVFGGEGLSCSGGSWERKAAWGGGPAVPLAAAACVGWQSSCRAAAAVRRRRPAVQASTLQSPADHPIKTFNKDGKALNKNTR